MNLEQFKSTVGARGLAKNSHWVCKVYPPAKLMQGSSAVSDIFRGNGTGINLPGIDIFGGNAQVTFPGLENALTDAAQQFDNNVISPINQAIDTINNASVDIGPISISSNTNIPTLGFLLGGGARGIEAINLYCQSCSIPARDLLNSEFGEYGEVRSLGVKHTHSDLTLGYYCSENLTERLFFEQWQNLIFNPTNKRHSYYKDYVSMVEIIKYDSSWKRQTAKYEFVEAYPTNIGETALSYDGTDLLRLDITFKFRNYKRTA